MSNVSFRTSTQPVKGLEEELDESEEEELLLEGDELLELSLEEELLVELLLEEDELLELSLEELLVEEVDEEELLEELVIFCLFLNSTTAHWSPPATKTLPSAGVTESISHVAGTSSVIVCQPSVTLLKRRWPVPSFCLLSTASRQKVNCGTGVMGFPVVSKVSLRTSMHPVNGEEEEELETEEEELESEEEEELLEETVH